MTERLGVPDVLVNNAGIVVRGPFATLPFAAASPSVVISPELNSPSMS